MQKKLNDSSGSRLLYYITRLSLAKIYYKGLFLSALLVYNVLDAYNNKLSFVENWAIGCTAGMVEIAIGQPLEYLKIARQKKLPLLVNPSVLYRGSLASAVSYVPSYGVQIALYDMFLQKYKTYYNADSSRLYQGMAAFVAGVGSAGIITPSQVIAIQQQIYGSSLDQTIQKIYNTHGIKSFARGFGPTAYRWGGFSASYLVLNDFFKNNIKCFLELDNTSNYYQDLGCTLLAGIPVGILGALVTHPFDTIKTAMQADFEIKKYTTMSQTAALLYKEEGCKSFLKGITPRTARVVSAVIILNTVKHYLTDMRCKALSL